MGFRGGSASEESACDAGGLGWEDGLEKGKAPHSSILAWTIPCTLSSHGIVEFYKAALVVLHSLCLCLSMKLFVSLWNLNETLVGWGHLACRLLPFISLNASFKSLLAYSFCRKIS